MNKELFDKATAKIDEILNSRESSNVNYDDIIAKRKEQLMLKSMLEYERSYVNTPIIIFHFYDFLLTALYEKVKDVWSLSELEKFSFPVSIKKEDDKVTLCSGKQKLEITEKLYKEWGIDLPEIEEVRRKYFGKNLVDSFNYVLEDCLKSECNGGVNGYVNYEVARHYKKSAHELKDRIIEYMKYEREQALSGYELAEKQYGQKTKNREK